MADFFVFDILLGIKLKIMQKPHKIKNYAKWWKKKNSVIKQFHWYLTWKFIKKFQKTTKNSKQIQRTIDKLTNSLI